MRHVHFVNDNRGAVYEHDERAVHQFDHFGAVVDQHDGRAVNYVNLDGANYVNFLDDDEPGDHNHNVTGFHFNDCGRCTWLRAQQRRVL